jgi:hypothetical protein
MYAHTASPTWSSSNRSSTDTGTIAMAVESATTPIVQCGAGGARATRMQRAGSSYVGEGGCRRGPLDPTDWQASTQDLAARLAATDRDRLRQAVIAADGEVISLAGVRDPAEEAMIGPATFIK